MHVPGRAPSRPPIVPLVGGTLVGGTLVVGGLLLAYIALATPVLGSLLPGGRPDAARMAVGMLVWAIALVAPAAFLLAGANRLARTLSAVRRHVPHRSGPLRALHDLPEGMVWLDGLILPDGRPVSNLVVGPFGAAVVRELPPAAVTRVREGRWEARGSRGWIALEDPLERAARDAERVRRWMGHDDADFVVKVYAAVVGPEPTIARTAGCAVLAPEQLTGWLGALPPQRSLTESRRAQMIELARSAAPR